MKSKILLVVSAALMSFTASASSESLLKAVQSTKLKAAEAELAKEGYQLKSISETEAGEGYINQCGCLHFTVLFKKTEFQQNFKRESSERKFDLDFDMMGAEILTEK